MVNFIYSISPIFLFSIIICITLAISISCMIFVEKYISLKSRHKESQNLGYSGTTVGIIFAIIAGFTISYAMNNFNKASDIVEDEANQTMEIFRMANRFGEPTRSIIKNAMFNYVEDVLQIEWPNLKKDQMSMAGLNILNKLNDQLTSIQMKDMHSLFAEQDLFSELNTMYTLRNQRVYISQSSLIGEQWVLLCVSIFLTLFVNCILGMELRLHIASQFTVSLMLAAILFLIVSVDRPFRGSFSVKPKAFETVMAEMHAASPPLNP